MTRISSSVMRDNSASGGASNKSTPSDIGENANIMSTHKYHTRLLVAKCFVFHREIILEYQLLVKTFSQNQGQVSYKIYHNEILSYSRLTTDKRKCKKWITEDNKLITEAYFTIMYARNVIKHGTNMPDIGGVKPLQ